MALVVLVLCALRDISFEINLRSIEHRYESSYDKIYPKFDISYIFLCDNFFFFFFKGLVTPMLLIWDYFMIILLCHISYP